MNNFFYDLNKRMAALADKQDTKQISEDAKATAPKSKLAESMDVAERSTGDYSAKKAAAGKDIGKPGKAFSKIAKSAGAKYGSKAAGERVAGAVLNKLRHPKESVEENVPNLKGHDTKYGVVVVGHNDGKPVKTFDNEADAKVYADRGIRIGGGLKQGSVRTMVAPKKKTNEVEMDESAFQAAIGKKKYGDQGMKALQKAGREHASAKTMSNIRNKYDKYDESQGIADEGNAFTAALKSTPKGGKFKVGGKEFTDTSSIEEGFADMDAWLAQREKEKGTGRFEKKERTLPGGMKATTYTRKHEDDAEDDNDDSKSKQADKYASPKKKGRPKSAAPKDQERVTKGSHKYKTVDGKRVKKEKTKEGLDSDGVMMTRPTNCSMENIDPSKQGEYNDEAGMAKDSLHTIVRHAKELERALRSNENMPEWVQEKIGQIKGMMSSVTDYIVSTHERDAEQAPGEEGITTVIPEKAVSKAQRKFMGMAHAIQKGEKIKGASPELKKVAKSMKSTDTHDFAATKEKGLPNKVKKTEEGAKPDFLDMDKDGDRKEPMKKAVKDKKEEKVDETTVSGSVATATTSGKSSGGGMQFGKGVYEGFNKSIEKMITESINVADTIAENEGQTITVTASGLEADMLMQLLKAAGLTGQSQSQGCGCGQTPCSCDETVDEAYGDTDETLNKPDWPTDKEKLAAEPNLRTYSGGLNGPKSSGQTTTPILNRDPRRQASMEESVELERSLFKTWKNYKG
jgi:hypothetical protein